MDTFIEQIVAIKKTPKIWVAYIGIALLAVILMAISLWLLGSLAIIVVFLIGYGAFKLYSMLNVEYEYIVTNSTMDIDKIIAKSSRKRMISFDLGDVQRIEKYTGSLPANIEKDCFFACNKSDENAFVLYYKQEGKSQKAFVFAPNERVVAAMKGFLPRHICENL